jgi:hypothetical protein
LQALEDCVGFAATPAPLKMLTADEARRIAANLAKLLELLWKR